MASKAKLFPKQFWELTFVIFVSMAMFLANPFGVMDITGTVAERISLRAHALLFDQISSGSNVMVVVLDDKSVDELAPNYGYPVPFSIHAQILRPILCSNPASLYIDIDFRTIRTRYLERETDEAAIAELYEALSTKQNSSFCKNYYAEMEQNGDDANQPQTDQTNIYLARTRTIGDECAPFPDDQNTIHDCSKIALFEPFKDILQPLPVIRTDPDKTHLRYPLLATAWNTSRFTQGAQFDKLKQLGLSTELSPAAAMTIARCQRGNNISVDLRALCTDLELNTLKKNQVTIDDDLVLIPKWKFYLNRENPSQLLSNFKEGDVGTSCRDYQLLNNAGELTGMRRSKTALYALAQASIGEFSKFYNNFTHVFSQNNCLSYPHVAAGTFSKSIKQCSIGNNCGIQLDNLFKDKAVIYGQSIEAARDFIKSPIVGLAPGVFLHAAATDNLIGNPSSFWREGITIGVLSINESTLFLMHLICLFAWLIYCRRLKAHQTIVFVIGSFVLILPAIFLPPLLNLAPFDWLGPLALISIIYPKISTLSNVVD